MDKYSNGLMRSGVMVLRNENQQDKEGLLCKMWCCSNLIREMVRLKKESAVWFAVGIDNQPIVLTEKSLEAEFRMLFGCFSEKRKQNRRQISICLLRVVLNAKVFRSWVSIFLPINTIPQLLFTNQLDSLKQLIHLCRE